MKRVLPILTMVLSGGFAATALAAPMSESDILQRLKAQKSATKMQPASIRTDEDGNALSSSGYMAMPAQARIMLDVQFKVGSATVTKAGGKQVEALCSAMKAMDTMPSLHLIGHTDRSGDADKNLAISEKRAAAVRSYIDENCGIPAGLMLSSGEGEAFAPEDGPANNADDRRIEVQIITAAAEPEPAAESDAEETEAETDAAAEAAEEAETGAETSSDATSD